MHIYICCGLYTYVHIYFYTCICYIYMYTTYTMWNICEYVKSKYVYIDKYKNAYKERICEIWVNQKYHIEMQHMLCNSLRTIYYCCHVRIVYHHQWHFMTIGHFISTTSHNFVSHLNNTRCDHNVVYSKSTDLAQIDRTRHARGYARKHG
jgi:hypothetical protein